MAPRGAVKAADAVDAGAVKPHTLVLDNGGYSIKAGMVTGAPASQKQHQEEEENEDCLVVPNCIARDQDGRVYVGAQVEQCRDPFHLVVRRPVEHGMVVDWEQQRAIWYDTLLSGRNQRIKVIHSAIRRLDVGGKQMTNYLIDLLAVHEVSLTEDVWIANQVKEACCYVTDDFKRDMEKTWRGHHMDPSVAINVQLPDYVETSTVIVKPYDEQERAARNKSDFVTLGNERFQVPEILFNPGDIGMVQGGLAHAVMQSISVLPEALQYGMLASIIITGGNVLIPGLVERFRTELRQLAPTNMEIRIQSAKNPLTSAWWGGVCLANEPAILKKKLVTREQYFEYGSSGLLRRSNNA